MARYLHQSRHGIWYYRRHIKTGETYRQVKVSLRTVDRYEAQAKASQLTWEIKREGFTSYRDIRTHLLGVVEETKPQISVQDIQLDLAHVKPATRAEYQGAWKVFIKGQDKPIDDFTQADVKKWADNLTGADSTRKKKHMAVRAILKVLGVEHLDLTFKPTGKQAGITRRAIREDELAKVIQVAGQENESWKVQVLKLAAITGLRLNEVCQLHTDDIYREGKHLCLRITDSKPTQSLKTKGSARVLVLGEKGERLLSAYENKQGWVFPFTYKEKGGYGTAASRYYGRLFRKVGLPTEVVFHSIRHRAATVAINKGVSKEVVSSCLGHIDFEHGEYLGYFLYGVLLWFYYSYWIWYRGILKGEDSEARKLIVTNEVADLNGSEFADRQCGKYTDRSFDVPKGIQTGSGRIMLYAEGEPRVVLTYSAYPADTDQDSIDKRGREIATEKWAAVFYKNLSDFQQQNNTTMTKTIEHNPWVYFLINLKVRGMLALRMQGFSLLVVPHLVFAFAVGTVIGTNLAEL